MSAGLNSPIIGRMAPSPTGRIHIGNVYAALAAWLGARSVGGQVRLRIEDIDTPRVVADADRWIMDDLHWLGLDWDGSVVYQSQRAELYRQAFEDLKSQNLCSLDFHAAHDCENCADCNRPLVYPCFCSRADIRAASAPNEDDGFIVYPGTCRKLSTEVADAYLASGERHSWRIAVPDGESECSQCNFQDCVFGEQSFSLPEQVGDVVLMRSDGVVSYQLAVAVDDIDMGITQVVRGRDLLRSTAIQLWIRHRLECWNPIEWAHLPLVDGVDGRRLSKRFGSFDMGSVRERSILPEQVLGLCAWLLGLQEKPEATSLHQLKESFSWERIATNPRDRVFDFSFFNSLAQ